MSRGSKILLGFFSFLPILLTGLVVVIMLFQFRTFIEWEHNEPDPTEVFATISPMIIWAMVLSVVSLGMLIYFIIHLVKNKEMDGTEKAVWILALILGGIICYPIYWYMKIWKDE